MIRHMVLFTLKDDIEETGRAYIFGQARKLAGIESVRGLEVVALLDPKNEVYKERMWREFKNALLIDFDDEDGLEAYQSDPFHVVFAKEIRERASVVKVVDFVNP